MSTYGLSRDTAYTVAQASKGNAFDACEWANGADPIAGYGPCDRPASWRVTYRNGSYGPYEMRVCDAHRDAAKGRFHPGVESVEATS